MAAKGDYQVIEGRGGVGERDGRHLRPLAVQPSVPGLNTVGHYGDLIVAAGAAAGRPYASVSRYRGRHWLSTPVPFSGDQLGLLRVAFAPDGAGWLIGERAGTGSVSQRSGASSVHGHGSRSPRSGTPRRPGRWLRSGSSCWR